jgi:ribosomal protein L11 methyltransferase
MIALFADQALAEHAARILKLQDFFDNASLLRIAEVPPQDWVRLTQSQFEPVEITSDLWVVPSWHEAPAQALQVIRLDPGLAFGTGTHPTTRMCLRWIALHLHKGCRVLDYGCGSGILAIGAALCGAAEVDAVDIDADAVTAAQANALANHVSINTGLPDLAQGPYGLVVANILAAPLKVLAPLLCAHVAQGGHLLLAGILSRQIEEIQQAYAPFLQLQVADTQDGWVLMTA